MHRTVLRPRAPLGSGPPLGCLNHPLPRDGSLSPDAAIRNIQCASQILQGRDRILAGSEGFDYEQSALVAVSVVRDAAELDSFVFTVWGANQTEILATEQ